MWRTYTADGTLAYSFVDSLVAMYPYYIARTFGGLLFLLGTLVGCYNIWMTVRAAPATAGRRLDVPEAAGAAPSPAE
jgi:cytochrome c oxidase cbb3-type subunit 1